TKSPDLGSNCRLCFRGVGMPHLASLCAAAIAGAALLPIPALAAGESSTVHYAVTRNGDPIGATTVNLRRDGDQLVADVATHVQVKVAFVTVYRFEQHET